MEEKNTITCNYEKRRAFVTSHINIDHSLWVPEGCNFENGYYHLEDSLKLEREDKGLSREKFWVINSDGEKQAIFAQNFERNENILSLIYCALADLVKVPCMSSAPAKRISYSYSEPSEIEGLISLNICGKGIESLKSADEFSKTARSIEELKKSCEAYAQKNNCFIDEEFSSDILKQVLLDYITLAGDKSSLSNYNIASIKTSNGSMLAVAPALDNGLSFGLRSKSFWFRNKPQRTIERLNEINYSRNLEDSKKVFYKEFGEVLPIMPFYDVEKGEEPGVREESFLEQMSVALLENDNLLETYNKIKNVSFDQVKGVMQSRYKELNIGENAYFMCETVFNHRLNCLDQKLNEMSRLKNDDPGVYQSIVSSMHERVGESEDVMEN